MKPSRLVSTPPSRLGRRAALAAGSAVGLAWLAGEASAATSEESARGGTSGGGAIALGEGRNVLALDLGADAFHAIALLGPAASLRGVAVVGDGPGPRAVRSSSPIDEDGLLPR